MPAFPVVVVFSKSVTGEKVAAERIYINDLQFPGMPAQAIPDLCNHFFHYLRIERIEHEETVRIIRYRP